MARIGHNSAAAALRYQHVIAGQRDQPGLHIEAVTNANLTTAAALTPGPHEQLKQRGFREKQHHSFNEPSWPPQTPAMR